MKPHLLPTLIALLTTSVSLASCSGQRQSESPEPFDHPTGLAVQLADVQGYELIEIPFPVMAVVQTTGEWERINEMFVNQFEDDGEGKAERIRLPHIDFTQRTLLVGSMGEVPCMLSEPATLFDRAVLSSDTLYAGIKTEESPIEPNVSDDICLTAIDYVVHVVSIPRHDGPVVFYGRKGMVPERRNLFDS